MTADHNDIVETWGGTHPMTGLVILAEVMLMMVVVMVMLMIVVMMISHPMTGLVILAEASRSPWSRCEERRRNDLMTISIRL